MWETDLCQVFGCLGKEYGSFYSLLFGLGRCVNGELLPLTCVWLWPSADGFEVLHCTTPFYECFPEIFVRAADCCSSYFSPLGGTWLLILLSGSEACRNLLLSGMDSLAVFCQWQTLWSKANHVTSVDYIIVTILCRPRSFHLCLKLLRPSSCLFPTCDNVISNLL